jgi:putative membrane protein
MNKGAVISLVATLALGATASYAQQVDDEVVPPTGSVIEEDGSSGSLISDDEARAIAEEPAAPAEDAEIAAVEISDRDAHFLSQAATIGLMEVQGATIALDKATDPDVMEFARRMLDEQHAADRLKALSKSRGVTPAAELRKPQQKAMAELKEKSGADFDKAYAKAMIDGHEDAIRFFKAAARKSDDNEVRSFAAETLETLEQRLQMARQLEDSIEKNAKAPQKQQRGDADSPSS